MKQKGMKAHKGDKSPIESPESPTNRSEHPHPSYHPYSYPYAAYADPALYSSIYANYNMFGNPAMAKGVLPNYPYYPYPQHYPEHLMDPRRPGVDSEECLSPSMVLDPVAAALFLQIPHPHIPHPSALPRLMDSSPSHDRPQWVPNDLSAFTPKALRSKLSPSQHPPGYHPDLYNEQQSSHMVPQHSPRQHSHISPQHVQHPLHSPPHHPSGEYLIQLPELRLPEEKENRKLSTLEPTLFRQANNEGEAPSSPSSPSTPSSSIPPPPPPPPKWQLPEWFKAERKDSQQRSETQTDGEVCVPSDSTPPPLSVGEWGQPRQQHLFIYLVDGLSPVILATLPAPPPSTRGHHGWCGATVAVGSPLPHNLFPFFLLSKEEDHVYPIQ